MKGIYNWVGRYVHAPYGTIIFCLLVFIEGIFIMPVSTLLTFYALKNRKKAFLYGALATIMSAFGALLGYSVGYMCWNLGLVHLIYYFVSPEKFAYAVELYKSYQAMAVFFTALTPLPFKVLTISAGFCQLPLLSFISYTMIARGIRFLAISTAIFVWGDKVEYYLDKYFYYFLALFISSLVLMWWIIH